MWLAPCEADPVSDARTPSDRGSRPSLTVGDLFRQEPEQWGLRGDPYVWQALAMHLKDMPLPEELSEFERRLKDAFRTIVGIDLDDDSAPEAVFREEFAHGGMSSGQVSVPTWRDRLVPLLVRRADQDRGPKV